MKNQIKEWKKSAVAQLQVIETSATVYKHQMKVQEEEKPSIFYTIAEKRLSIADVLQDVKENFPLKLPQGELSQKVLQRTLRLIEHAARRISHCSSLFIAIETNWGSIDPALERVKFYDHYHPPRGDKTSIRTLSYFEPLHLEAPVSECFNYCNLLEMNLSGKPAKHWLNSTDSILDDFHDMTKKATPESWKRIPLPQEGTLEIAFDSFNNFHNLSGLSDNLFLTIVINDVEFYSPLKDGHLDYSYFHQE